MLTSNRGTSLQNVSLEVIEDIVEVCSSVELLLQHISSMEEDKKVENFFMNKSLFEVISTEKDFVCGCINNVKVNKQLTEQELKHLDSIFRRVIEFVEKAQKQ